MLRHIRRSCKNRRKNHLSLCGHGLPFHSGGFLRQAEVFAKTAPPRKDIDTHKIITDHVPFSSGAVLTEAGSCIVEEKQFLFQFSNPPDEVHRPYAAVPNIS